MPYDPTMISALEPDQLAAATHAPAAAPQARAGEP